MYKKLFILFLIVAQNTFQDLNSYSKLYSNNPKGWKTWISILNARNFEIGKDLIKNIKYQGTYKVSSRSAGMYYPFTKEGTLRLELEKGNIKLLILTGGTSEKNVFYFNVYEIKNGKLNELIELYDFDVMPEGYVKRVGSLEDKTLNLYRTRVKDIINKSFEELQLQLDVDKLKAAKIVVKAY